MEERVNLKRSAPSCPSDECIICQESKKDILFTATQQGLRSLKESSEQRQKLRDIANTEAIDRIMIATDTNNAEGLYWHKSCYAKFTDKGKINRLRKSLDFYRKLPPCKLGTSQQNSLDRLGIMHVLPGRKNV